jgi:hypothetical protein
MAASFAKNEIVAAKRRVDLIVYEDGAISPAPRGTDFMALGAVYVCGPATPHYTTALGTVTNKRKAYSFTSFTFPAAAATDLLTKVSHGLETGDGPINVSNAGGALPAGLAAATDYWVIRIDADTIKLATSLANAYAGTAIDLTTDGTGTQTLAAIGTTQRGLDGLFTYEATQAETDFDGSEFSVIIDGTGFARANNGGTYTTVAMGAATSGFEAEAEGGHTYGDLMRLFASVLAGKVVNFNTGTQAFRDLADSKTRITGTTDTTGRLTIVINDLT